MGGFCPHITCPRPKPAAVAEADNGGTGRRGTAAGGRGQSLSRGNCSGQGLWPQSLNRGRQPLSLLDPLTWGNTADHPSPCSTHLLTYQGRSLNLPLEAHLPQTLQVLDPEGRKPRSPRRCVRLYESCLGHQVPCCDPCATCYCRFFNAFCYCRKLGTTTNPCSRT